MTMGRRMLRIIIALSVLAGLLLACKPFGLQEILDTAMAKPLALDPAWVTVPATATVDFTATGGVPPYSFSLASGSGSVDPATGRYAAPATVGSAVVRVTDKAGNSTTSAVTVEVLVGGLRLSPSSITITINGSVQFDAIGGAGGYSYAVTTAGSGSPDVNAATGYYVAGASPGTDVVTVTDAALATATATVTVQAAISNVNYTVPARSLPAAGNADTAIPGGATFTVTNAGTADGTVDFTWKVYLAKGAAPATGDIVLASGTHAALTQAGSTVITVAGSFPPGCEGSWNLIAEVAAADDVTPADNRSVPSVITVAKKDVDYTVTVVTHTAGTVGGGSVSGTFTVDNAGTADGSVGGIYELFASVDAAPSLDDFSLCRGNLAMMGAADAPATVPFAGTWPSMAGTWFLVAQVSFADESDTSNDFQARLPSIAVSAPVLPTPDVDYEVTSTANTGGTTAGGALAGRFTVTNAGSEAGTQTLYWNAYRSADAVLDPVIDAMIDSGSLAFLGPGASHVNVAFASTWPSAPGTWWLFVKVSATDDINPLDNWTTTPPSVATTEPDIDYQVLFLAAPTPLTAGDPFTGGTFQLHNEGTQAGSQGIGWTVYRSPTTVMNPLVDAVVDAGIVSPGLGAAPAFQTVTYDGSWPIGSGATWRLYVVVAAADERSDRRGNNTSAPLDLTTTAPPVDYTVTSVANVVGLKAGKPFTADFSARNAGTHAGTVGVAWRAYISSDALPGAGDQLLDSGTFGALGAGVTSVPINFSGTWPLAATDKQYYLIVTVSAGDDVNPVNDYGASSQLTVVRPDVNYQVLSVLVPTPGTAGGALSGSFTFKNNRTDDGSRAVTWTAYRSDDATLGGGDPVIASGSEAPLAAGVTSSPVAFSNSWPAAMVTKTYYIFVVISAADDTIGADDTGMSAMVTVNPPNVDYEIQTLNWAGTTAGGPVTGSLLIKNIGTVGGGSAVTWTVYRSSDPIYSPGVDVVVDYNTTGPLGPGLTANPAFSGTWPEDTVPRQYYLIARVSAVDDSAPGNNEKVSPLITVTPPAALPDYLVTAAVTQPSGKPGEALASPHQFQIQNAAANAGTKTITWRVYISRDAILDGADTQIASNTIAALPGGGNSGNIPYGGTWPTFGAFYRLIVSLDADDDSNPSNDTWVSPSIEVPKLYNESDGPALNGDFGPTNSPLVNVADFGLVLQPDQLVRIDGTMDAKLYVDTYKFALAAGTTRLHVTLKWATATNACNMYLWDESNNEDPATSTAFDIEEVTFVNIIPLDPYYVGLHFIENNTGAAYQLYIEGRK